LGNVLSVLLLIWANIAFHLISLNVMYREAIIIIRLLPLTVYSFESQCVNFGQCMFLCCFTQLC